MERSLAAALRFITSFLGIMYFKQKSKPASSAVHPPPLGDSGSPWHSWAWLQKFSGFHHLICQASSADGEIGLECTCGDCPLQRDEGHLKHEAAGEGEREGHPQKPTEPHKLNSDIIFVNKLLYQIRFKIQESPARRKTVRSGERTATSRGR